jgi:hypothetical protein
MKDRGCRKRQIIALAQDLKMYRYKMWDYGCACGRDGDVRNWWLTRSKHSVGAELLIELAILLLDIPPDAGAPVRIFSAMERRRHSRFRDPSFSTTAMLTAVKAFHEAQDPRSVSSRPEWCAAVCDALASSPANAAAQ